MPAELRPGYDHPHFGFRTGETLHAPQHSGVAVVPVIVLETYEDPLPDWPQLHNVGGGLDRDFPNISRVSTREYGHRVGIYRMLQLLDDAAVSPTVAIDAMTAEMYPTLVAELADRNTEFIAHGISVTRPIGAHMSESQERAYIAETMDRLAAAHIQARGWFGPEYGESERTPALLADADLSFVMDWCCDERPIATNHGALVAYPMNADLDDQTTLITRMATPTAYTDHLTAAVRYLEQRDESTILSFAMRPWIVGQPFRIHVFEQFLTAVGDAGGAELTSPSGALARYRRA